jgi:hypothetical protein
MNLQIYFETMAGTHLRDAVDALRNAGSADALYEPALRAMDPSRIEYDSYSIARDEAQYQRVSYSRRSLLFAAFAAEAYANDFLYERWGGQDREALKRLSTVDKYVVLVRLDGRPSDLTRGKGPIQGLRWLFKRRDELVHAAPQNRDLTYDPANHNPRTAAQCIVAVGDAAAALSRDVPSGSVLSHVLASRQRLLDYGARAAEALADLRDPPRDRDLLRD